MLLSNDRERSAFEAGPRFPAPIGRAARVGGPGDPAHPPARWATDRRTCWGG